MRVWRRRVVTVAVAGLLLVGGCTAAPRGAPPVHPVAPMVGAAPVRVPLPAAPRGWSAGRVLGVVWRGAAGAESAELGWLDALSLRPRPGRRLSLGRHGAVWGVAPDGSLAVFGDGGDRDDGSVLVVDPRRLRRVGTVRLGRSWQSPFAASWLGRSRVLLAGVGVTGGPEGDLATAVVSVVDLAAGRVVARRRIVGEPLAAGRLPDGLVLLLGGAGSVGPARLVVVDGDGGVRTVRLPAIAAGFLVPQDRGPAVGAVRWQPGLAVDPAGRRAFVVGREAPVAEVDLRGLRVRWHWLDRRPGLLGRLAGWLLPAAEAKSVHGPVRRAAWLGGGLLAVWGHDDSEPVVRGSVVEQWSRPAGLRVVDTRTWRAVTVHANAGAVAAAGGRLLAWGRLLGPPPSADVNVPAVRAFGLTVFGPGDRRPLHLFGSRQVSWLQVSGGRAYVDLTPSSDWWVGGDVLAADREVAVVDLGSGRVLAEWRGRMPALLVGGCCDGPVGG
jgi:hypothetical protein